MIALRRATTTLLLLAAASAATRAGEIENFAFIQISDSHISPHLARLGDPPPPRGANSIAWICESANGPQAAADLDLQTPSPSFAIATGDLTEFGVIDDTWDVFRNAFGSLQFPLYVTPGNHDNTWVAMFHVMRDLYGGANYSIDQHGCHFVFLNSATAQEPIPSLDATTRAWLAEDLANVQPGTPIFIAFHHPIAGGGFANPAEYDTLTDMLLDHNVVLVMYGHGHSVRHRNLDGIDGVMGGSTYGKNAGYAVYSVKDGKLRMDYHYFRRPGQGKSNAPESGWARVLEKPIQRTKPNRLFELTAKTNDVGDVLAGKHLAIRLETPERVGALRKVDVTVDGEKADAKPDGEDKTSWHVPTDNLDPGWHLLTVRAWAGDKQHDLRTLRFRTARDADATLWRINLPASMKAKPLIIGDRVVLARTDGVVSAHDRRTGGELWSFKTGGEILGTPLESERRIVFGSGDGNVYALDFDGHQLWSRAVGQPVYAEPVAGRELIYVGDNGGRLHALDPDSGNPRWTFRRADYSIEARACLWKDMVIFGAWDGYLYALDTKTGEQRWKVLGPKASEGKGIRYYAPADCGPIAIHNTLFACDRGYYLGTFNAKGEQGEQVTQSIAAITHCTELKRMYARAMTDFVACYDAHGTEVWKTEVPAGRFPIPPTYDDRYVYVCSNSGVLNVLDQNDGKLRWQYKVTPGFYVMAPVGVDERGVCYVAGMDGTVTALQPPLRAAQAPVVAR
jgi:outer membrane protein assembly factor BamB